jgi:subtilase family serine protease
MASAQTWVSTATQGVGNLLTNATPLGSADPSMPLDVALALQLNNKNALAQYVSAINDPTNPAFETSLSVDQFVASYAPTAAQVQQVVSYLNGQGFSNVQVEPNNLFVTADGSVSQANTAFNTVIGQYLRNGATVYANITAAEVPASPAGIVAAVLGLNNAAKMTTPIHVQPSTTIATPAVHFCAPQNYWTVYDAGTTPNRLQDHRGGFRRGRSDASAL